MMHFRQHWQGIRGQVPLSLSFAQNSDAVLSFRLEIDGFTYSRRTQGWKKTSKFVVAVAVSMYPY